MKIKQITVKLPEDDANKLTKIARKNNLSTAEQVRRMINQGLSVDAYSTDEEKILSNMKKALREVIDPQIDRFAKLSSKSSISSSINMLLSSMLMYRLCKPEQRPKLEQFLDEARRLGISFVKLGKGSIEDFIKNSMEKLNIVWDD